MNRGKTLRGTVLFLILLIFSSCGTLYQKHTIRVKPTRKIYLSNTTSEVSKKHKSEPVVIEIKQKEVKKYPARINAQKESPNCNADGLAQKPVLDFYTHQLDSPEYPMLDSFSRSEKKAYRLNNQANILTISSTILLLFSFLGIPIILSAFLSQRALRIYDSIYIPQATQLFGLARVINWIAKFLIIAVLLYIILILIFIAIIF